MFARCRQGDVSGGIIATGGGFIGVDIHTVHNGLDMPAWFVLNPAHQRLSPFVLKSPQKRRVGQNFTSLKPFCATGPPEIPIMRKIPPPKKILSVLSAPRNFSPHWLMQISLSALLLFGLGVGNSWGQVNHAFPDTPDLTFAAGTAAVGTLPLASGDDGSLVYSLSVLPMDMSFNNDRNSRAFFGAPMLAGDFPVTYSAENSSGVTVATADFMIKVNHAFPRFTNENLRENWLAGFVVNFGEINPSPYPEVLGGGDNLTYGFIDDAGDFSEDIGIKGVTFTSSTRVMSGRPLISFPATSYTYAVTQGADVVARVEFEITIQQPGFDNPATPPFYPRFPNQAYAVGESYEITLPEARVDSIPPSFTYELIGANIPGLSFDAEDRTWGGMPTEEISETTMTYKVTVIGGGPGRRSPGNYSNEIVFTMVVYSALGSVADRAYEINTAIEPITLPEMIGGGNLVHTIRGLVPPGLSFTGRVLSGTPTLAGTYTLTYAARQSSGVEVASTTFTLTVTPRLPAPNDMTFIVGSAVNTTLPKVVSGGTSGNFIFYYNVEPSVPSGLTFTGSTQVLSGVPITAGEYRLTYTATEAFNRTTVESRRFTITITPSSDITNEIILPEVATAMASSVLNAIGGRMGNAVTHKNKAVNTFSLGGQNSLAGMVKHHGKTLADGGDKVDELISGTGFSMHLGDGGLDSGGVFWGNAEYSYLAGERRGVDWQGAMKGWHLGFDSYIRNDLLLGLSLADFSIDIDYTIGENGAGIYDIGMTSINPYLGWSAGQLDLWAMVGYGKGGLAIKPAGGDKSSSDISMNIFGLGISRGVLNNHNVDVNLKGEVMSSDFYVEGSGKRNGMKTSTTRIRSLLEVSFPRNLGAGKTLAPSVEVGLLHDGGDGQHGGGLEVGGTVRYQNAAKRFTAEGNIRTLIAQNKDRKEWGVQGTIVMQSAADGQGLGVKISPSYGNTASAAQQLWEQGLIGATDSAAAESAYAPRLDARLSYGVTMQDGSLLSPYSELSMAESDHYRVGINWKPSAQTALNLVGERTQHTENTAAKKSVLLTGGVRF